mmetsp:Transcript_55318/g.147675  ORF Transcript_55318/g.147675 Transcript_55318/m.147675 type:complete len:222 (-) Transcript_55318:2585-3250(-)
MPPPLLFCTTMVNGGASGPESCWKALRSYSVATSPINSVTGPSQPRQKPIAVLITPSMPEAPRFADSGYGGPWSLSLANMSMSRMGIELEEKRRPRGCRSCVTVRATRGSVKDSPDNVSSIETSAISDNLCQKQPAHPTASNPASSKNPAKASNEHVTLCVTVWSGSNRVGKGATRTWSRGLADFTKAAILADTTGPPNCTTASTWRRSPAKKGETSSWST